VTAGLAVVQQAWDDERMSSDQKTVTADEVKPGDRIRHPSGTEMTVSRIEASFFGRPEMLAFIEDTPERWLKAPVPKSAEVTVLAEG
jgi:hypothetical protein